MRQDIYFMLLHSSYCSRNVQIQLMPVINTHKAHILCFKLQSLSLSPSNLLLENSHNIRAYSISLYFISRNPLARIYLFAAIPLPSTLENICQSHVSRDKVLFSQIQYDRYGK